MSILGHLEPNSVFHYFEEICNIPHGSGNIDKISDYLVEFAKKHAQDNDIDFYVFGHRHIVLDLLITPKQRVAILGDWIQNFSYGMWDGNNFSVEYFLNE